MKTIISKHKKKKIETLLYAGLGATCIVSLMEGRCTDNVIKIRDDTVREIMKLLN